MEINKLKEILKIIEDKVTMDQEGRGMDPDVILAFDWLIGEVNEAKHEYINKKKVWLEDEMGDLIWTVFRLIEILNREKAIDKNKIFDRCIKKYSQRVYGLEEGKKWNDIKKIQKEELKKEQDLLDN